ncbi:MAG: hypothetical protein AAFX07_00685 [Pseudomonadota bacterium]
MSSTEELEILVESIEVMLDLKGASSVLAHLIEQEGASYRFLAWVTRIGASVRDIQQVEGVGQHLRLSGITAVSQNGNAALIRAWISEAKAEIARAAVDDDFALDDVTDARLDAALDKAVADAS